MPHAIAAYPEAVIAVYSLRDRLLGASRRREPMEFNFLARRQGVERYDRMAGPYGGGAELPFTSNENCLRQPPQVGLLLHFLAFSRHGLRAAAEWGRRRNLASGFWRHDGGKRRFSFLHGIKG